MMICLTVFVVLLAMFFFGGEVIHAFSLAMLLGVVSGSYSTIYVASAIVLDLEKWMQQHVIANPVGAS